MRQWIKWKLDPLAKSLWKRTFEKLNSPRIDENFSYFESLLSRSDYQTTSKLLPNPLVHPSVPRKFPSFETESREMPANLARPSYAQKHRTCKACDLERAKAVDVHSHANFRLANPSAMEQLMYRRRYLSARSRIVPSEVTR